MIVIYLYSKEIVVWKQFWALFTNLLMYKEKVANLLYMVVKNHVFIDGNKRIAATLFIYALQHYDLLFVENKQIIDNNTLVAITLLIAESNPKEKNILIDLVLNFLNNK